MQGNFHYTKSVNNSYCQLFDIKQDAISIHPMIREIHGMIQQLKPRPKIIITIGDAITVTTIGNYSHNDWRYNYHLIQLLKIDIHKIEITKYLLPNIAASLHPSQQSPVLPRHWTRHWIY